MSAPAVPTAGRRTPVRHHRAALRQRPVPHRPHHGVHPGRHLGALPADAGPRGALRLRRRHARRADHAQGRGRGHHAAGSWSAASPPTRPKYLDGFHVSFDNWHSTDSPENVELSQDIYRKLRDRGPRSAPRTVEQFYDPVKGMFLPDRYIKGECPKCGAKDQYGDCLRGLRRGLRADRPEEPLLDDLRRDAGAASRRSTTSSGSPTRAASRSCATGRTSGRLQPEVANKAQEWLEGEGGQGARRLGHLARRAVLRHPDPRRAGQVLLRLARRADRLPRQLQGTTAPKRGARLRGLPRRPTHVEQSTSSARTSSTSTRCSGRRC